MLEQHCMSKISLYRTVRTIWTRKQIVKESWVVILRTMQWVPCKRAHSTTTTIIVTTAITVIVICVNIVNIIISSSSSNRNNRSQTGAERKFEVVEVVFVELGCVSTLGAIQTRVEGSSLVSFVPHKRASIKVVAQSTAFGRCGVDRGCQAVLCGGVCSDDAEDFGGVLYGEDGVVEVLVALAVAPLVKLAAAGAVVAWCQVVELPRVREVRPVRGVC